MVNGCHANEDEVQKHRGGSVLVLSDQRPHMVGCDQWLVEAIAMVLI